MQNLCSICDGLYGKQTSGGCGAGVGVWGVRGRSGGVGGVGAWGGVGQEWGRGRGNSRYLIYDGLCETQTCGAGQEGGGSGGSGGCRTEVGEWGLWGRSRAASGVIQTQCSICDGLYEKQTNDLRSRRQLRKYRNFHVPYMP